MDMDIDIGDEFDSLEDAVNFIKIEEQKDIVRKGPILARRVKAYGLRDRVNVILARLDRPEGPEYVTWVEDPETKERFWGHYYWGKDGKKDAWEDYQSR